MLINKLKTAGSHNYCRKALVVYNDALDISLVSCGTEICAINKKGVFTMKCGDGELSAADKRHLKIFLKRFKHRLA